MRLFATKSPEGRLDDEFDPIPICPVTGAYCTGDFCDDYGCAKSFGFWDETDECKALRH